MLLFAAAAAAGVCYHSSAAALAPGLLAIMLSISILSPEFSSFFAVLFAMCFLFFPLLFSAPAVLCNYTCIAALCC